MYYACMCNIMPVSSSLCNIMPVVYMYYAFYAYQFLMGIARDNCPRRALRVAEVHGLSTFYYHMR